jgi:hypothetical protein
MGMLALLLVIAVAILAVMFATKRSDLGFVAAIFWFLAGTQAYIMHTSLIDIYYYIFWTCSIGMTLFCINCSMGMRRNERYGMDLNEEDMPEDGEGRSGNSPNYKKDTASHTDITIHTEGGSNSNAVRLPKQFRQQPSVRERSDRRRLRVSGGK